MHGCLALVMLATMNTTSSRSEVDGAVRTKARKPMAMKTVLTIAGTDSGTAAGAQADVKTIAAHSAYAVTVLVVRLAAPARRVGRGCCQPPIRRTSARPQPNRRRVRRRGAQRAASRQEGSIGVERRPRVGNRIGVRWRPLAGGGNPSSAGCPPVGHSQRRRPHAGGRSPRRSGRGHRGNLLASVRVALETNARRRLAGAAGRGPPSARRWRPDDWPMKPAPWRRAKRRTLPRRSSARRSGRRPKATPPDPDRRGDA